MAELNIAEGSIEEVKTPKQADQQTQLKQQNKEGLDNYKFVLKDRLKNFRSERFQKIESIMKNLRSRADMLKEHVTKETNDILEKYDNFVQEFLTTNKYDFMLNGDGYIDFEQIVPVKLAAESPVKGNIENLFECRSEIQLSLPEKQANHSERRVHFPENLATRSQSPPPLPKEQKSEPVRTPVKQPQLPASQTSDPERNVPIPKIQKTESVRIEPVAAPLPVIQKSESLQPKPKPAKKDVSHQHLFSNNKFETASLQEYFTFSHDDQVAACHKAQILLWSSVTVKQQLSAEQVMAVKFRFSAWGFFGICRDQSARGIPGYTDSNGWTWGTSGSWMNENAKDKAWNSEIGDMRGKEIEMIYYVSEKRLKIRWEGKSSTETNPNWPAEPYFVFSLGNSGASVSLVD